MGNVVVAVVDDPIVLVGTVILVGRAGRERGQFLQVLVCHAGHHLHEVAAHLTLKIVLVGYGLKGLQHTECIIHRVGLLVHVRVEQVL